MSDEIKKNWTAIMSVMGLTLEQVNALTIQIVEAVESMGGLMAGGFTPDEEEDPEGSDVQER
jgi:hypothetical protein